MAGRGIGGRRVIHRTITVRTAFTIIRTLAIRTAFTIVRPVTIRTAFTIVRTLAIRTAFTIRTVAIRTASVGTAILFAVALPDAGFLRHRASRHAGCAVSW